MATRRHILIGVLGTAAASGVAACAPNPPAPAQTPSPTRTPSPTATPTPEPTTSSSPTSSTTPDPDATRAPLTWLPVDDPATLLLPAVALKVPNLRQENPQTAGFALADLWFCQPNGHSATRLVPVFHSAFPESVGPIRSLRPVDVPLLSPLHLVLGNTGAADWVMRYVKAHEDTLERMTYLEWRDTAAFSVDRSRVYKANGKNQFDRAIMAHPAAMARLAERMTAEPPSDYLPFVADPDAASSTTGRPAQRVSVPYGDIAMAYEYDAASGQYARQQPWGPHVVEGDTQLVADNVLIIRAKWQMGKIWDGAGAADPVVDIIDSEGRFTYLHRGRAVSGTWAKGAVAERFTFTLDDGDPLAVAPGRTWVELPHLEAHVAIS